MLRETKLQPQFPYFEKSTSVWERQQKNDIIFPPTLLNVGLAFNAIENFGFVPSDKRKYIEANVRTQAFEAVAPGVRMRTYQAWDNERSEFVAYGYSSSEIYQKGLGDIARLRNIHGSNIDFEEKRRQIELLQSMALNGLASTGQLNDQNFIWFSAFPENADTKTAKELGYFPDKKIAMIRTYDYDQNSGLLVVDQIAIENSSVDAFAKISADLTGTDEIKKTPEDILAQQILVPKHVLGNEVVDIACLYDEVLEKKNPGKFFFLGEMVDQDQKDYENIVKKTAKAEDQTTKIIDHMVDISIETAISLKDGSPTVAVQKAMLLALQKSGEGNVLIDERKRAHLIQSQFGKFDIKAAEALIEFVTKNDYLSMLCLTNPKRAKEIFNQEDIDRFLASYKYNPNLTIRVAPPILPGGVVDLYFCGSTMQIGSIGTNPMSELSIPGFNNFLRGNKNWDYHTGSCVNCHTIATEVGPCNICKSCEKVLPG